MMLTPFGCIVATLSLLAVLLLRRLLYKRSWDLLQTIPGAEGWPLLGSAKELALFSSYYRGFNPLVVFLQSLEGLAVIHRKDKLFKIYIGPSPVVVLFTPETLEPVYKSNSLINKGNSYDVLEDWLGEGLITSSGAKWRQHRKLLTPTFHFRILDDFLSVMNEQAAVFVKKVQRWPRDQDWMDAHHHCSLFTFDVICETAMGVSIGAQENENSPYIRALLEFTEIAVKRLANPILTADKVFYFSKYYNNSKRALKVMLDFTKSVVDQKIIRKQTSVDGEDFQEGGQTRLAFLDLLLDLSDTVFDSKTLREQVDTFMFAGHDTTGSGLAWTLYLLGLHPDIQSRVQQELDDIFGADQDRDVTQEDLKQTKYLECVIKESMRIFPPVPFISRVLSEDTLIGGHLVPKGTELFLGIAPLHHNPDVYPNPEVFDPDRFLPENSAGRHPFAYTPFSAGPRNCIGQKFALMEEKVFLCQVLRHFRVSSLDPRDKLLPILTPVLRNDGPLKIRFRQRP